MYLSKLIKIDDKIPASSDMRYIFAAIRNTNYPITLDKTPRLPLFLYYRFSFPCLSNTCSSQLGTYRFPTFIDYPLHQLLDELAEEQARLDAGVAAAAEQRSRDQQRILASVAQLESEADQSTAEVAAATARLRDPAAILARLEVDRRELEQLVIVRQEECDALRKHDVSRRESGADSW